MLTLSTKTRDLTLYILSQPNKSWVKSIHYLIFAETILKFRYKVAPEKNSLIQNNLGRGPTKHRKELQRTTRYF